MILYHDMITHTKRREPLLMLVKLFQLAGVLFGEGDLSVMSSEDSLFSRTILARVGREKIPYLPGDNLCG